ncbi:MAG: hypothetical protein O3A00_05165, partial [Planctomycetota bacterium]|nr:hypothetical protein [Planctomycetota bacterium]
AEHAVNVDPDRVTVIFVVPSFNDAFRETLTTNHLSFTQTAPGCHRIEGGQFHTWCVETSVDSGIDHPGLSLLSPLLLKQRDHIIEALTDAGFSDILSYVIQLIRQFQTSGSKFALHHTETDLMVKLSEDVKKSFLDSLEPHERLEGVSAKDRVMGLSAKDRVMGLSAEDRVMGLSAKDRVMGLSAEELIERLTIEDLRKALPPEVLRQLRDEASESR